MQFDESRCCKVIGTQGVLNFDFGRSKITYNTKDNVKWVEEDIAVDVDSIYLSEYENVPAAFKGKDAHFVSGEQSYKTMEAIEAVRQIQCVRRSRGNASV